MSYQVLARKWRPTSFDEVVGQDSVVKALSNALNSGRLHHAYLFVGTRGVGKTTLARLLAKALNCEKGVSSTPCGECMACKSINAGSFPDLIEIDAASKTGVDDTREILENVQYAPTSGKYKVYLIDEVHMFSKSSFNAMLKTLEEPPEHVKFLLATTNAEKLPVTILSRCMQLRLQRVEKSAIVGLFEKILSEEKIECDDKKALEWIAQAADGSIRDGLSLLDQSIALGAGTIKSEEVHGMLGLVAESYVSALIQAVIDRNGQLAIEITQNMFHQSGDCVNLLKCLIEWVHQLALVKHLGKPAMQLMRFGVAETLVSQSQEVKAEEIQLFYDLLQKGQSDLASAINPKVSFEMLVLRLIAFRPDEEKKSKIITNNKHGTDSNQDSKKETENVARFSFKQESTNSPDQKGTASQSLKTNATDPSQSETTQKSNNAGENDLKVKSVEENSDLNSQAKKHTLPDLNGNNWGDWLQSNRKAFSNIVWQYLRNSQFKELSEDGLLKLGLKQMYVDMCNDIQKKQIVEQLNTQFEKAIKLEFIALVEVENTLNDTLEGKALKMIEEDVGFQKMRETLDLKLDEKSIRIYDAN